MAPKYSFFFFLKKKIVSSAQINVLTNLRSDKSVKNWKIEVLVIDNNNIGLRVVFWGPLKLQRCHWFWVYSPSTPKNTPIFKPRAQYLNHHRMTSQPKKRKREKSKHHHWPRSRGRKEGRKEGRKHSIQIPTYFCVFLSLHICGKIQIAIKVRLPTGLTWFNLDHLQYDVLSRLTKQVCVCVCFFLVR